MKKLLKDSIGLTKFGVVAGVGSAAVVGAGGSAAGLSALSSFAPVMGTVSGAGATFRALKKIKTR